MSKHSNGHDFLNFYLPDNVKYWATFFLGDGEYFVVFYEIERFWHQKMHISKQINYLSKPKHTILR